MSTTTKNPAIFTDPLAWWRVLPPPVQEAIGAAAIAYELSCQGASMDITDPAMDNGASIRRADAHEKTADAALAHLQDLFLAHLPDAYENSGEPRRVNLNPLGIRQCLACGCTEGDACDGGCHWVGETLCSACLPQPAP